MIADLDILTTMGNVVRVFSVSRLHRFDRFVKTASRRGIKTIPSAFLNDESQPWAADANEDEITSLIHVLNTIDLSTVPFAVVGSEAIEGQGFTAARLNRLIARVRRNVPTSVKITTAETWANYVNHHDRLADNVDLVFANIYPYWENVPFNQATDFIVAKHQQLKDLYNKPVVISETGWPSAGNAPITSLKRQQTYWKRFKRAARRNRIDYFGFEAFDEPWKATTGEGPVGAHWGLWRANRAPKGDVASFDACR